MFRMVAADGDRHEPGQGDDVTDAERLANIPQQDRELNSWAFRSFRDIADGDYIAARLAYRAQLPAQFLWASQQALEKYLVHPVHSTDSGQATEA